MQLKRNCVDSNMSESLITVITREEWQVREGPTGGLSRGTWLPFQKCWRYEEGSVMLATVRSKNLNTVRINSSLSE